MLKQKRNRSKCKPNYYDTATVRIFLNGGGDICGSLTSKIGVRGLEWIDVGNEVGRAEFGAEDVVMEG
jgi:hypothetical protein